MFTDKEIKRVKELLELNTVKKISDILVMPEYKVVAIKQLILAGWEETKKHVFAKEKSGVIRFGEREKKKELPPRPPAKYSNQRSLYGDEII